LYVVGRYYPAALHTITVLVESIEGVRIKSMGFEVNGPRFCGSLVIELTQSNSLKRVVDRLRRLKRTSVINSKQGINIESGIKQRLELN
jgi:hypothetical protein